MFPNNVQAVVFDFGGVLLDWDPRNLYRNLISSPDKMEQFLSEIHFSEWNMQQDRGRPFAEAVAQLSSEFPHYAHLIRAYHERWEESISGPISGSVEILRALKASGHPVYGLSNWSAETFPIARDKYDFLDLLDGYLISGEVGLVKPDPAIFRLFLDRIGKSAGQCLLIDDSQQNIEAAHELGFGTIHFQSPHQLADELRDRGCLQTQ